ncbi:MAG: hypothetical protein IJ396_07710 [Oscillibacter sp.]|nr:hypothetical protein [Oscillibacter sp.]MBQ7778782.1 hypothetical protein [Oscillibacter sp.]
MNSKDRVLARERQRGREAALDLAARAPDLDGTAIIAEEENVPAFDPTFDYSGLAAGSPVRDEGQVWQLIQPHNAAHYTGRPATLRALWSLCHTKDPARAKPWVDAYGTSGMYMTGECYLAADGTVKRAKQDNLVHDAEAYPAGWEDVTT